jgi:hypothetical protein
MVLYILVMPFSKLLDPRLFAVSGPVLLRSSAFARIMSPAVADAVDMRGM